MSDPIRTKPLSRNKLTSFFKDFELVKFFENISLDVSGALPANGAAALQAAQQAQLSANEALGAADDALDRADAAHLGIFGQALAQAALGAGQGAQRTADDARAIGDALQLGIFGRRAAAPGYAIQQGDLIIVTQTAGGQMVSVDVVQLLIAIRSLTPRAPPAPAANDAGAVLAARIFRK